MGELECQVARGRDVEMREDRAGKMARARAARAGGEAGEASGRRERRWREREGRREVDAAPNWPGEKWKAEDNAGERQ